MLTLKGNGKGGDERKCGGCPFREAVEDKGFQLKGILKAGYLNAIKIKVETAQDFESCAVCPIYTP